MDEKIKEFTANKLQEIKSGKNPVVIASEVDGYLEALRDAGIITPIECVDIFYDFSINMVKATNPDISSEQAALKKLNNWKDVLNIISEHM
ncbi:hypothetical protein [Blautia sp. MSJ-19]|uniref:hypothetical protein n=1 Tax=Blautia sp. MSJ-19 TaxID=2841517 RepID=UPI001C0E924D|nr:hypothetical protein [Blautia sp. MSJ-19]MBU5482314.1 hypothetical protein [Blautia sp. MSJ-19]